MKCLSLSQESVSPASIYKTVPSYFISKSGEFSYPSQLLIVTSTACSRFCYAVGVLNFLL